MKNILSISYANLSNDKKDLDNLIPFHFTICRYF